MPRGNQRGYITQPDEYGLQARYAYKSDRQTRYFPFSAGNARRKANRWLARMRRKHPGTPALHRKKLREYSSSGTPGVYPNVNGNGYYSVRVNYSLQGKTRYKTFGVGMAEMHSSKAETIAMLAAEDFRAAYVKARDTGQEFCPEKWDDWRVRFA